MPLDYAKVLGRLGTVIADGPDVGDEPDTVWCSGGTVTLEPLIKEVKVLEDDPVPSTRGVFPISMTVDENGYLTRNGQPHAYVLDLTSDKVTPRVEEGRATHSITFVGTVAGSGADTFPVTFQSATIRITKDGIDGDGLNDITRLTPLRPPAGVAVSVGPRGVSVEDVDPVAAAAGDLVFSLTSGDVTTPVPLPVGPGGDDAGVASHLAAVGSESGAAAKELIGAAIEAGDPVVVDPLNAQTAEAVETPGDVRDAVDGRVPVVGDGRYARTGAVTKTDAAAGILDWLNSSPTSGYLFHLRTGAGSGAGTATIGIGTDQGSGNGLIISHKNSARGLSLSSQPGAGIGAYLTGRSSQPLAYFDLNPGSGPVVYQSGTAGGFADGTTTNGTPTLTSATAAFTSGDVGKSVSQLTSRGLATDPSGCIPAGTTIASVQSSTSVTMSQNAQATGSAVLFAVSGRTKPVGESLWESRDEASAVLAKLTKAGLSVKGGDPATAAVKVTGATGATTNIFETFIAGNATPALNVASNGILNAAFTTVLTNAGLVGAPSLSSLTYSSHTALALRRSGAATGDMLQARGDGSTALSRINRDGFIMTAKNAAPADADLNAGEIAFWFDSTNGAAKLKVKAKEAGGTVRTGEVALA